MAYTLAQLADDIRTTLEADPGRAGKLRGARVRLARAEGRGVRRPALKDRPEGGNPREVLYEDPKLGFCICGHVYEPNAVGNPHDHGIELGDLRPGDRHHRDDRLARRREGRGRASRRWSWPSGSTNLKPGDAHFYDVGDIHSPRRMMPSRLIRVEGANLDHVKRSNIKAKA